VRLNLQGTNFHPPSVWSSVGGFDVCWKNKNLMAPNITTKESMALKSLKDNKETRIVQSDKGN
jgi:hypothetical protein